ncbi:tyrosine-type recombinase/integrase [Pseudomaricurvus hydrocarbonicus]|uniref:tyrosine-type recombinase/integrase n=1 Tax=Pseudomaricurvus hydrocarbonicus TaxID=1470433 RepID=UPI003C7DC9C1
MGFHGRLTAHGLRSLASKTLNEEGLDPDVIEAALVHVDKNAVRAAYNRADYLKRGRTLMEWWGAHIERSAVARLIRSEPEVGIFSVSDSALRGRSPLGW